MTTYQEAEKILSAVQHLRAEDAVAFIEAHLQHAFIKGERAGLEAAQQAVSQIGQQEQAA